ncbi:nickel transporter [Erwinia sp. OLTSP20]|nr:nickel transporter [Erwinia sp. OAMSP11]PIJ71897.1 nickel transporter [Erwinia sp. OLSSP12]PIJ81099.1 nickel transporter [Erwinia sp. OLCASP19]PIJ83529.1 nickel transporter [Erwinia sp. OLMTSP26]PIJ86144.1 nickel transporter [Erwinia sp. OLMDSP33]PIJ89663.1 nickel transporter [Erwinia sp. OLFS4]PIJ92267.1 nickel transporter [Erwinia sp. OLTSP20]
MTTHSLHLAALPRRRAILLLSGLITLNLLVWLLSILVFRHNAALMGTALLAWSFGLRHALDADHIAAIDNVTRKLMQQGNTPVAVGAWFSLGHSTIVILATAAIAATTLLFRQQLENFHAIGSVIGTLVSALFLLIIGLINLAILFDVWQKFRLLKQGRLNDELSPEMLSAGGVLTRLLKPLFNMVNHSWQMYLVGFLFGLGFDTATEVGLLGIAAASAQQGMDLWALMLFPALFTSGMMLIDSADNLIMVGAYGWAFARPARKLYYNMTITSASVIVALFIGGIEALGLLGDRLNGQGAFWQLIGDLNDQMGNLGFWVVGIFVLCWLISMMNYRLRGYDSLDLTHSQ